MPISIEKTKIMAYSGKDPVTPSMMSGDCGGLRVTSPWPLKLSDEFYDYVYAVPCSVIVLYVCIVIGYSFSTSGAVKFTSSSRFNTKWQLCPG
jgi:hypothetical protein